jgi:hypothetical protein
MRQHQFSLPLALLLGLGYAGAADWPQWRGPNRDGTTPERSGWEENAWPPKRLWQASVGTGCTSPLLIKGKVYVFGYRGPKGGNGSDRLSCLDSVSGRLLWQLVHLSVRSLPAGGADENSMPANPSSRQPAVVCPLANMRACHRGTRSVPLVLLAYVPRICPSATSVCRRSRAS